MVTSEGAACEKKLISIDESVVTSCRISNYSRFEDQIMGMEEERFDRSDCFPTLRIP